MTVEAAADTNVFLTFVQHVLAPTLRPGRIVVMDNLAAHKHWKVRRLLAAAAVSGTCPPIRRT